MFSRYVSPVVEIGVVTLSQPNSRDRVLFVSCHVIPGTMVVIVCCLVISAQ